MAVRQMPYAGAILPRLEAGAAEPFGNRILAGGDGLGDGPVGVIGHFDSMALISAIRRWQSP